MRNKKLEMEYDSFIYTFITYLMLCLRFRKKLSLKLVVSETLLKLVAVSR